MVGGGRASTSTTVQVFTVYCFDDNVEFPLQQLSKLHNSEAVNLNVDKTRQTITACTLYSGQAMSGRKIQTTSCMLPLTFGLNRYMYGKDQTTTEHNDSDTSKFQPERSKRTVQTTLRIFEEFLAAAI